MGKRQRKALLVTTVLGNNVASFINLTNETLHIKKAKLELMINDAGPTAGDRARGSLDEVPEYQGDDNDSRSNILTVDIHAGAVAESGFYKDTDIMVFERGELTLEPDEGLFLNTQDVSGTPTIVARCRIWYED